MLTRRQVVGGSLSLGAANLAGCVRPITAFCPDDPRISSATTPLTIDTHAHVFNGTDVQVEPFVRLVRGRKTPVLQYLARILQNVVWDEAPTGAQEIAQLRGLSTPTACGPGQARPLYREARQAKHEAGVRALNRALGGTENNRTRLRAAGADPVATAIRNLSPDYEVFRRQHRARQLQRKRRALVAGDGVAEAAVAFALRQFQYRYVNVFDFLEEYSEEPNRKIDLLICHLLDFDWPLARGNPTPTSIEEQIAVMEQISILSGGRVHCYAPYDPMKMVAHQLGLTDENPLDLVQRAVRGRGFIGVKMYPPMGFAPMGNAGVQRLYPHFWNREWLRPELDRPDFGQRLDDALAELYAWCVSDDVPIMAHTSASNGPCDTFEKLTEADYWKEKGVPANLRVNFGHFGDTEVSVENKPNAAPLHVLNITKGLQYAKLMKSPRGSNFYADSAYFSHALHEQDTLYAALLSIYRAMPILKQRLMYGSDWEMLLIEPGDTKSYLKVFEDMYARLDAALGQGGRLLGSFFGGNAVNYLALQAGQPTRARLDAFYSRNRIPTPFWVHKVDNPPAHVA